ncbi:uncharacterized protein B0J16DRAFT_340612 [Fusarium flagelliforme]|uniref:uncharacterized protein n=1 Tax=Fusarium flagelliforme TaxID=2675880 RepID=UPI001E8D66E1|nr:uncharacterized protein B0J16DRAFT_340612 [Fusarium flagelliforme]KAH7184883.1 hypothetical protein B0J16DRAFT_340612 [Fusarium flagelliforme]
MIFNMAHRYSIRYIAKRYALLPNSFLTVFVARVSAISGGYSSAEMCRTLALGIVGRRMMEHLGAEHSRKR